jgi:hypothetical protein
MCSRGNSRLSLFKVVACNTELPWELYVKAPPHESIYDVAPLFILSHPRKNGQNGVQNELASGTHRPDSLNSIYFISYQFNALHPRSNAQRPAARHSYSKNSKGTLALYTLSQYSFEKHKTAHGLYVLDLSNGSSWLFSNSSEISNAAWLGDGNKTIWLVSEDDGSTSFVIGDATSPSDE